MNTLFVGIDVSKATNEVLAMDPSGESVDGIQVRNDLPGAEALCDRIVKIMTKGGFDRLVAGIEATGIYGWHLTQHLRQAAVLQPFQPVVHTFNPKIVKGFKKAYPEMPKTDRVDAWVIADRLRFGRLPAPGGVDERYEALRRLTRTRFHLVQDLARAKQRFLNALFMKYSGFTLDRPCDRLFGATALGFTVETECTETLAAASIDELTERVSRYSRGRYAHPEEVAAAVQKAARSSYRLPKALADPVNMELATHLTLIRSIEGQVNALARPIEQLFASLPNTLRSVKGLGPVFAAGILAEIGDIHRFPDHNAVAKYAGLAWSRRQSGQYESEDRHLIRTGNRYLRYYMVEAASSLAVHDAEFGRYYQRKKAEAKTHAHLRALALTARKLVRLVDHLLRSGRLYNPLGAPRRNH
jgi:transposase